MSRMSGIPFEGGFMPTLGLPMRLTRVMMFADMSVFADQRRYVLTYCPKCGSPMEPGSAFCGSCGAPGAAAEEAGTVIVTAQQQPSVQSTMQVPLPPTAAAHYGAPGVPPVPAHSAPSGGGGGGKAVLFALLGLLLIGGTAVLLLGFAVGPKWFTGGGGSEQQKVVEDFLRAMEKKDSKLLISVIPPSQMEEAEQLIDYGYFDSLEEAFEELFFSGYESINFEGMELKTTGVKENEATVEVVKGRITMVDSSGDSETIDVKDSDMPEEFPLIKEGGKWYIDFNDLG